MRDSAMPSERALAGWNETDAELPPGFVHDLVERSARRAPDAVAVIAGRAALSYAELDGSANRLANHLAASLPGRHPRLGVYLERGPDSLIAQLAAFKLGAAAVLMDPAYPAERIRFMLDDATPGAVVTHARLNANLGAAGGPVTLIDADADSWRACSADNPARPVTDETICHVAYTSGSTGSPKGVLFRHGSVRNTMHVLRSQCGITPRCRGSWLCSPGFGLVQVDCFPLLAAGATVCVPDPDVAASPSRLRDWMVACGLTQSLVLTAMAERLWQLRWPADTVLRWMRVAGEPVRSWPPPGLPFRVLNVYGSAEATVATTADLSAIGEAFGPAGRAAHSPPIGRPVANVRTYVLDDRLAAVPAGAVGGLYVSGRSLSAGYLGRAAATAAAFVPNPLPGDPHPVLYRTGDLARYGPGGLIEVIGRTDGLVKIRGYRVHPGEVERALAELPGVQQCCVIAREDRHGVLCLVGYVEPADGAAPTVSALRQALSQRLPEFMLPASYVIGDLPMTVNGKVDTTALPEPVRSRPELDTPYQAPADPLERELAGLWSQILEVDGVGVRDSFFELGGDSLCAMRLAQALEDRLGSPVSLADLYREPTIRHAAELVRATRRDGHPDAAPRSLPGPGSAPGISDQPAGRRLPHGIDPGDGAELGIDVAEVPLDRALADKQLRPDLRVAARLGEQAEHLALPRRQPVGGGRRAQLPDRGPGHRQQDVVLVVPGRVDRGEQVPPGHGLAEERGGAQVQNLADEPGVIAGRQGYHAGCLVIAADPGQHGEHGRAWRVHIEQQHVGPAAGGRPECAADGGLAGDPQRAVGAQQLTQALPEQFVATRDRHRQHVLARRIRGAAGSAVPAASAQLGRQPPGGAQRRTQLLAGGLQAGRPGVRAAGAVAVENPQAGLDGGADPLVFGGHPATLSSAGGVHPGQEQLGVVRHDSRSPAGRRAVFSPLAGVLHPPSPGRRVTSGQRPAVRLRREVKPAMGYVFASRTAAEDARLRGLELIHDPLTTDYLRRIGVGAGWRCLEAGAGRGSIMRWLAGRVGPAGTVVATDIDTRHLDGNDHPRIQVLRHDVTSDPPPGGPFDLIHARFLLAHLPGREAVLDRLVSWLAPGGWLLAEDIDYSLLGFQPVTADADFELVAAAALDHILAVSGFDPAFGRRLPGLLRERGLGALASQWRTVPVQGGTPEMAYVTAGLAQLRAGLSAGSAVTASQLGNACARCGEPSFCVLTPMVVSAWGQAAGGR